MARHATSIVVLSMCQVFFSSAGASWAFCDDFSCACMRALAACEDLEPPQSSLGPSWMVQDWPGGSRDSLRPCRCILVAVSEEP
eukprot:8185733-Pyramimonas_sp.AAC.1